MILARERALEAQLARVVGTIGRRAAQAWATDGADGATAAAARAADEIARAIRPAMTATAQEFAQRLRQSPKCAHAFERKSTEDLDGAIARHVATRTAEAVVGITDSIREAIRRVIERAIAENLGQEETAALIVEATAGEIGLARARRIARTEIHYAAMYGQQQAAEASPLAFEKVWLATEDSRTRKGHAAANGQRVALDAMFTLETQTGRAIKLRYPGDTDAPPGEIINCRCVCLYEPLPYLKDQVPAPGPETGEAPEAPDDVPVAPEPDTEPAGDGGSDLLPERDLDAVPYERETLVLWAAGDRLAIDPEGTPRTGATVALVGPNDLYADPDAPEVDREVARHDAGGFIARLMRRAVLWQITVPAGPALPAALFQPAGNGYTVNSGVGRFGTVQLRVTSVTKTRWSEAAPKPFVDPAEWTEFARGRLDESLAELAGGERTPDDVARRLADRLDALRDEWRLPAWQVGAWLDQLRAGGFDEDALTALLDGIEDAGVVDGRGRDAITQARESLARPGRMTTDQIAASLAVSFEGERAMRLGEDEAPVPESVVRTLADTRWTKRSLTRWLEQLAAGEVRDKPGPGEPDEHQRILLIAATMDVAAAVPEGYTWET